MRLLNLVLLLTFAAVPARAAELPWHDDYATAYRQSQEEQKLLIFAPFGIALIGRRTGLIRPCKLACPKYAAQPPAILLSCRR